MAKIRLAAAALCLGILTGALPAQSQDIRLAVTDIVGLENLQREYAPFQKMLTEKTGMNVQLFPVPSRTAACLLYTSDAADE